MRRKFRSFSAFCELILTLILLGSAFSWAAAQTHISYGDTAGPFISFPSNLSFANSFIIVGYGERFDLPNMPGTIDSVDFVLDSIGSDSILVELVPDSIFETSLGRLHLPNTFYPAKPYARVIVHKQSIFPGSRTYVSFNKAIVPDSFFVLIVSAPIGTADEFRAIQEPAQKITLDNARATLFAYDPQNGEVINAVVDGNFTSGDTTIYADMDMGVTYEGNDGVTVHLALSPISAIAFPNPASTGNPISVSSAGSFVSAEIIDDAGRIVRGFHEIAGELTTLLPTQGLSAGVYNAILFHSDGSTSNVRFVIK